MKLPGMGFLRDQQAVKAFEAQERAFRDLVFYSEGPGDWPHMGPVIEMLLRDHDQKISYLTSDPADPGLRIDDARFRAFYIGSGTARTVLFARIDCRTFVMSLPDLGNLWLKRSVHPVHYVYLFHSMNSTHTSYRTGAFDNFDTIMCVGPHHVEEIRRTEEVYGLPSKELVEHGSVKLDAVVAEVAGAPVRKPSEVPEVLVAPTWGESSLIEAPVGREVIRGLLDANLPTVLRLHPMTPRRLPKLVDDIRGEFGSHPLFRLEEDMSATESWQRSDLMISDWSGAATEYGLATGKPVLYLDMPQKIMNPEWRKVGLPAFEDVIRSKLGHVVPVAGVASIPALTRQLARDGGRKEHSRDTHQAAAFNLGRSASLAAARLHRAGGRPYPFSVKRPLPPAR